MDKQNYCIDLHVFGVCFWSINMWFVVIPIFTHSVVCFVVQYSDSRFMLAITFSAVIRRISQQSLPNPQLQDDTINIKLVMRPKAKHWPTSMRPLE